MMTAFDAYKLYTAIKNHFTLKSYDFFKYNGKVNLSQHNFETRRDKYMFHKLSKKQDPLGYLVANLSHDPKIWVGDLFDQKCETNFIQYNKHKESLSYIFKNDLDNLLDDFDKNFEVIDGQYPHLLNLFVRQKISKESFIIINDCVRFASKWSKEIADPILWPKIAFNCKRFQPFMEYEKAKYCKILKERFSC